MPRRATGLAVMLVCALSPMAGVAGPFLSPPGVAQRALAGVGVAGPGSLASVWHNPATLVDAETELTIEWQGVPDRARNGSLESSSTWFAGASYVNRDKLYGTVATGIASYTPYTHKLWVGQSGEPDSAWGRSDVVTHVLGVPYALEIEDAGLALGVVGEVVSVDPGGSDLRIETVGGTIEQADLPGDEQMGYSAAFGLRYALHRTASDRVDIGGVVRTAATSGASLDIDPKAAAYLMPDKPGGFDLGLSWRHTLEGARELTTQAQFTDVDWGDSGSVRRHGLALALRTDLDARGPFRGGHLIWRAGYSRYTPDAAQSWMDWPEGSVLTGGVSFEFSGGTRLDLGLERRSEERAAVDDDTWLLGAALSFAY